MANFRVEKLDENNLGDVYYCIRENRELYEEDIAKALGYMKERLKSGWLFYSAYGDHDRPVAMAIAIPGSDPLSPAKGEGIYYLNCMDVCKEQRNQRVGGKIIEQIMQDLKAKKGKGLAVDCYGDFWMPEGFFAKMGFEKTATFPDHSLMAKKLAKDAVIEYREMPYKGSLPESGIQIDIQHWVICPVMLNNYRKIPELAKKIEPQAAIRERVISTQQDVQQWGGSGVYVNGKSVFFGPVKEEHLRKAIEAAKKRL